MRDPNQKRFMLNYYVMVIFLFSFLLALKLSGYLSATLSVIGFFIASPFIVIEKNKIRWIIVLVIFILSILLFPDLTLLREMEPGS